MAAPKMTMAFASLVLSGVFAHNTQSDGQSIVTVETQQAGTTTSNGVLLYSMNYCTVFQTTECNIGLATATGVVPVVSEPASGYSAPVDSITPAVSSTLPGEPKPTMVWSDAATVVTQPTATVYSVTDSIGSSAETNSVLAATGSEVSSSGAASASSSVTANEQSNSTSVLTHSSPSGSMTAPAAPDRTSAGVVLKAFSGVAFGTLAMAMALFM
ncbi:hypothetical protein BBK36DRAFT_152404 [Trichoderma citrinoviride]|uniref:Uncharacterized protein n=1 Tax=Trichoderma citrinoviride TaxID=58853 RepID=A0A2T4AY09_9HYPO|nr:hypothetical protein BBK36DRAFT_152404 [Trichoderma citrinoviride]PTB61933.1 hypothetical protein BBK36DRAFT_152404 [Trichoderma citrinoviride]